MTEAKWDQLDQRNKDKLLEQYRDVEVGHDWWTDTYDYFKEQCAEAGMRVDDINFSGFYSQGDGAALIGRVTDWGKFLVANSLNGLAKYVIDEDGAVLHNYLQIHFSSTHHNNQYVDWDLTLDCPYDEDTQPLEHAVWNAKTDNGRALLDRAKDLEDFIKDKAGEVYTLLENEYEHLTSDEVVIEWIINNCEDGIDELLAEQKEEEDDDKDDDTARARVDHSLQLPFVW